MAAGDDFLHPTNKTKKHFFMGEKQSMSTILMQFPSFTAKHIQQSSCLNSPVESPHSFMSLQSGAKVLLYSIEHPPGERPPSYVTATTLALEMVT